MSGTDRRGPIGPAQKYVQDNGPVRNVKLNKLCGGTLKAITLQHRSSRQTAVVYLYSDVPGLLVKVLRVFKTSTR